MSQFTLSSVRQQQKYENAHLVDEFVRDMFTRIILLKLQADASFRAKVHEQRRSQRAQTPDDFHFHSVWYISPEELSTYCMVAVVSFGRQASMEEKRYITFLDTIFCSCHQHALLLHELASTLLEINRDILIILRDDTIQSTSYWGLHHMRNRHAREICNFSGSARECILACS